jgi:tRNA dimethylallyltransferase
VISRIELIFLVGPTAVGKSAVAAGLARRVGGEVVSADSMQVYRGLDIISAKPATAERQAVPHHLIDVVEPGDQFDVARYVRLAREAVADIRARGRVPVVVGGSGMYVRALMDGIFTGPGRDAVLRDRLEREVAEEGLAPLYGRLKEVDPGAAARIHPHDRKRIIRALEVYELSGRGVSSLQVEWRAAPAAGGERAFFSAGLECRTVLFGLRRKREEISRRIDERVERMVAQGAVEEVKNILTMSIDSSATAWQSLGIKEIREYLEGRCSLAEAKEALKKNTRAFAKRQMTWFRRDPRIQWLDIQREEGPDETAEKIMQLLMRDSTRTTED